MYKLLYLIPEPHEIVWFGDEDATAIVPISRLKEQEMGARVLLNGVTSYMERQEAVQNPLFMLYIHKL